VTVDDKTVLPKGTVVRGSVKHASSSGRLKGRAVVALTLDRIEWNGAEVPLNTNSVTLTSADHKKRNLAWIGGGSGAGALVGALLGGGKGAVLGAAAGGGAGLAGAATTGKRQVRIPAESVLTFRLEQPLAIWLDASSLEQSSQITSEDFGTIRELRGRSQIWGQSFMRLVEERLYATDGFAPLRRNFTHSEPAEDLSRCRRTAFVHVEVPASLIGA
jgi:hypothetical protein